MNSFIKIPNALFDFEIVSKKAKRRYPIKPIDLYVYIYLFSSSYDNCSIKRKIKTIAKRCNVKDNKTIHSSINRLEKMGLIMKKKRHNMFGINVSNAYSVTLVPGGFFMLDRRYLDFNLGASAFTVLLYLNRCKNGAFACPSVTKISNATGLSEPIIREKIALLQRHLYLFKKSVVSQYGDYSNNNYFLYTYDRRKELLSIYRKTKGSPRKQNNRILNKLKPSISKILGFFNFFLKGVGKLFPNTS